MYQARSSSGNHNLELPIVLKQLGTMTAVRDAHLVEQSLLRTLVPMLGLSGASLYRVDPQGRIARSMHYSRSMQPEEAGMQRVSESVEEVPSEEDLPPELRDLFENVRLLETPSICLVGDEYIGCYPVRGGGELWGYFLLRRDRALSLADGSIVQGMLEVFTNFYDVLDTSQRDRLTGLLNRYSLDRNLDRLWNMLHARVDAQLPQESRRHENAQRYWIAVLDVDHFKRINDAYGHVIGDEVLVVVARLLATAFRRSDLLYRYGGEEFIAIIAANDVDAAMHVFERARSKIEGFDFPRVGRVTVSGGFSGADPVVLPQEVIHRADSALYEAKHAGRNLVFHYDSLVRQGVLRAVLPGSVDIF